MITEHLSCTVLKVFYNFNLCVCLMADSERVDLVDQI